MAKTKTELREWISNGFTRVEDVAYVGLGLVLAVTPWFARLRGACWERNLEGKSAHFDDR